MPVLHGGRVGPFSGSAWTGSGESDANAGGNYVFADGHVKWVPAKRSFRSAMWNVNKGDTTGVQQP